MKGMFFILAFVIQAAIKCQATFCSGRYENLQQEIRNHLKRCTNTGINSQCCDVEKSSLKERKKNHKILCGKL